MIAGPMILECSVEMNTRDRLRSLFPADDYIETQDFSLVHRTILDLNSLDLDTLLATVPKSMIDACDVGGRTALFWTARYDHYNAMLSLLKFKVDTLKATYGGFRPLDAAIFARSQRCCGLLLEHMASVDYKDPRGWSPLHGASYGGFDLDIIGKMLTLGCYVNVTD